MFHDVAEFHRKFGLQPVLDVPHLLGTTGQLYRLARMLEELHEFQAAYLRGDLVKAADALADLLYFTMGTAYLMQLPLEAIFSVVHEANMFKVRARTESDSKYHDGKDIVKPADWASPEGSIAIILRNYGYVPPK